VVLQRCCSGVTHSGVAVVLQLCYSGVMVPNCRECSFTKDCTFVYVCVSVFLYARS
jgi:hypothetical protein